MNAPTNTPSREPVRVQDQANRKAKLRDLHAHCRERREREFAARYATA